MLKSRFISRLYWALVILVCVTLVVLALYVGVFGIDARDFTRFLLRPGIGFYEAHKAPIDQAFVIIGTSVAAVTGGLTVLKSFFYAEMNLPRRAQELIDDARERHLHARPDLVAYLRGPSFKTRDFLTPTILANPLAQVLQLFGWSSIRTRARDVATSVQQLTDELRALHDWKEHTENCKFTAHLLRALCLSAQALEQPDNSYDRKNYHKNALKEYEDAVALRGNDLEALEGAAALAAILGESQKQLAFLSGIINAAEGDANRLRRARAQRLSAMLMNLDPDQKQAARERLLEITQNQSLDVDNPVEREELAETFLSLGIIQVGRGRIPTGRRMLTRARTFSAKILRAENVPNTS